jgi:hypothetical protein
MGFVARDLGVDADHVAFGKSNHHGVNEIWSNELAKWVLLDAKYDVHYERAGVPLSALEVHEAVRAGQGDRIVKVEGPERKPVAMKGLEYPVSSVFNYFWVGYIPGLRAFTGKSERPGLVVLDSEEFRATRWMRGSPDGLREHWAYRANAFIPTRDRHQIDWTPGVPDVQLRQVSPSELDVTFGSITPNLETYRVRTGKGQWQAVQGDQYRWKLGSSVNTLDVQTRNRFGVLGPVVTVAVKPAAK